ncbi:MAG: hypothetical protein KIC64_11965, partial [Prevotella buccae]|uniref:hypothetical protein n=2 Tax=Segatella buccae TaxID=28126 RepID=UPI00242C581A
PALIFLVIATAGGNLFGFLSQLAYNSGILSKFAFELNHWIVWQMLTGRNRPIRNRKNRQPIIEPTNNSILYSEQMLHKYCMTGFKALSLIAQCLNVKVAIFLIIGL